MSDLGDGWDASISAWVNGRPDVQALVQFGSRARQDGTSDRWSDYDYHIITSRPEKYRDGSFVRELGACWASAKRVSWGNVTRVTSVYENALEADFIVLSHLEMLIVALALKWPSTAPIWPRALANGVTSLKIAASPGWKVIKGGELWEMRYRRITPHGAPMNQAEFLGICGEFWVELVWTAKKVARGEFRAGQRAIHEHLIENSLRIFREEATIDGRISYPVGRRAESWLTADQLSATMAGTRPDRSSLMGALVDISDEFAASTARLAKRNGWGTSEYPEVRAWLSGLSTT
jgi:hypothetical protein